MGTARDQSVTQPVSSPGWSDEEFAEFLTSHCEAQNLERLLDSYRSRITPAVIKLLKDRVAHLIRADIPQAVKLADATQVTAAVIADPTAHALAHHASALALHFSGRYADALNYYERAEEIYSHLCQDVEAARIARAKVDVLMYLGQYETALDVGRRACKVFEQRREHLLFAQTQENVGNVYHRLDRYRKALECYERARQSYESCQYEFGIGSADYNAANQYVCLNDFERALTLYQQAQDVFERLEMPLLVNQTEYSIAWLYFQRGRFQESLKLFAKVRASARELGDALQEALCDLDLAEVYLHLNAYQDAIESARSAVEKFGALEMAYERIKAKMYLGVAHASINDLATAQRELEEARHGFRAEGNEIFTAFADIYLSEVFRHQRVWHRAQLLCAEARQVFNQHGLAAKGAYAELQLARVKLAAGDTSEARQLCQSALVALGEIEAPQLKYQVFHLLGNLVEQTGDLSEAYRCYTQAVEHLEDVRRTIRVDEFKWTFISDKLKLYEDLVELCARGQDAGMVEESLAYAEMAKSRVLVDLLSSSNLSFKRKAGVSLPGTWRQEMERLREELTWYQHRTGHHETEGTRSSEELTTQLREATRQCEQQFAKVVRQMEIEDSEYASLQTVSRPNVAELRHSLAEDEALVEYYIVDGRVKVFVLSRETVHLFNDVTTMEAVSPLLRQFRFCVNKFTLSEDFVQTHRNNIQEFTDACLKGLYAKLIAPVASLLEGKKIVVVPHGLLHYVPFHALHNGEGYMVDRHEMSYAPSASVFKFCADKAQLRTSNGRLFMMAVSDEATPFIHEEIAALKSLWPDAHVVSGADATVDRLKQDADGCRILHLAAHATFRRDNPLFSTLKLADAGLSFYDIFRLDLQADLVTLSACETGMNGIYPGDELVGLMRGFLYAGAPSLVVSSWIVKDRSTAEFMRQFYKELSRGRDKRTALRRAQLAIKRTNPHPYFWAPFILIGAPFGGSDQRVE